MIKKVLSLVIFLLLANAAFRVGVVYFHDQQFKDAIRELALFSSNKPDELLRTKIMELAAQNQVPLDPDFIEITRKIIPGVGEHAVIKLAYAVMVPVIPGKPRRFEFDYITE
jgi:hypothetical protein